MKKIKTILLVLLSVCLLWASVDVSTLQIKPEFMKPGTDMDVIILMKKVISDTWNPKPIKMVAVISDDDSWSDDDMLFIYDGGKNTEPLTSVDGTKQVYSMTGTEWFEGWFEYSWPTKTPASFMHGQKKFIIFRIAEGNPNFDPNKTIDQMEGNWFKEIAVEFEVAENKAAIYNTAYVEDKSDTAKFIISKGLPDAFIEATPPGNGIAGIGTETVFSTMTLGIELKTTDKVGAKIYYTLGNSAVDISDASQLYDSTKGIQISGTDTLRAIAVVPGYKNREGVWYYTQDLPDAYIYADPSVDTPSVYTFTTATFDVELGIIGKDGDTLTLSESVKLYYTLGNEKPVVGNVGTKELTIGEVVTLSSSDTIRAIAVVDGYDEVPEGIWYYKQDLPEAYVFADPSVDTPSVYSFTTSSLDVELGIIGKGGDTLTLSDSVKLYYTLGNEKPVVGDANTTQLLEGDVVTITGNDTIRALAIVGGYDAVPEGIWYYEQNLPALRLVADAGNENSDDTLGFYDDTTVVIKAVDPDGNEVAGATIHYLIDSVGNKGAAKKGDGIFSDAIVIDTTLSIRAVAYHDDYLPVTGEWNYKLLLRESWLHAFTSDNSYLGDSLILGDSIKSSSDTAHFGHNLFIVLESNCDSIFYEYKGNHTFNTGDTIYLTDVDPDTVLIKATAKGHGYETITENLVFVRDTVAVLSADPAGYKFVNSVKVALTVNPTWRNQTIWFDTTGGDYELYERPISMNRTTTLKAIARADFAVESKVLTEEYLLATSITEAFYLDVNANGAIDKALLKTSRDITVLPSEVVLFSPFDSTEFQTIAGSNIEKVDERTITVKLEDEFAFYDNTTFETKVYGSLKGSIYEEGGFALTDSVAPVIIGATYAPGKIKSIKPIVREDDQIEVLFSEKVAIGNMTSPFELKRGSDTYYSLSLKDGSLEDSKALFFVKSISGVAYPESGDSIHIALDGNVLGVAGIEQLHEDNLFVPLTVLDIPYMLLIQAISPVTPWEYSIPDDFKGSKYASENALLVVADFLMKMENENQDAEIVLYDKVGNVVASSKGRDDDGSIVIDLINDVTTKLVFYWDGTNSVGRRVGAGKYIAEVVVGDGRVNATTHKETLSIGVVVPKGSKE